MKEKQPVRPFRWQAIAWPSPPWSRTHQGWKRGAILVCSSLDDSPPPLHWHLGITYALNQPSDEIVREVLADFGMEGAAEYEIDAAEHAILTGGAPRSRHFRLAIDGNN